MNLLAFDTATEFLSIALQFNGQIFTYDGDGGAKASEAILPQIQTLLNTAKIQLNQLDGIAFGAGPGAFTGVRVACGVAQGLGFGGNISVVGINTLHALSEASGADKVIVCQDARMGEIYFAALQKQGDGWFEIVPTSLVKPDNLPKVAGDDWFGVGSGWTAFQTALETHFANNLTVLPSEFQNLTVLKCQKIVSTAEALLKLAKPIFASGLSQPASEARPLYVRNRVALTAQQREAGERL